MLLCRSLWFATHSLPLINRICNSLWLPIWRFRSLHGEHICPTVACSDSLLWAKECLLWFNSRRRFAIPSSLLRDRMTRSLVDYPTTAVDAFSSRWRCCSHMYSPPDFPKDTRSLGHAYTSKATTHLYFSKLNQQRNDNRSLTHFPNSPNLCLHRQNYKKVYYLI